MAEALKQLSQGLLVSAAVAEFKGPVVFGVVRLIQVKNELAKIEASFSGLTPGKHGWSINEFGDLTKGPETTGNIFDPITLKTGKEESHSFAVQVRLPHQLTALGHLQSLDVDEKGHTSYIGFKEKVCISDLIGRSIVVYQTEKKSDPGIKAAVIARAAGVGDGCKKICACNGTPIWDLNDNESVPCKI